jgi:hypothetical protein
MIIINNKLYIPLILEKNKNKVLKQFVKAAI